MGNEDEEQRLVGWWGMWVTKREWQRFHRYSHIVPSCMLPVAKRRGRSFDHEAWHLAAPFEIVIAYNPVGGMSQFRWFAW